MSYKDQSYYLEFRELLERLSNGISQLKSEKKQLEEENRLIKSQLENVQQELSEARHEIATLKNRADTSETESKTLQSSKSGDHEGTSDLSSAIKATERLKSSKQQPGLFEDLSENDKIALRQQINDLIARIDFHLSKAGEN